MSFTVVASCPRTLARSGELATPHGLIPTPAFAPVGSQGTVKTLSPLELTEIGVKLILANTYHLMLRPGAELVARRGGLHHFMAWDGAILSDSGGYQVFSLGKLCQVNDQGVLFRSHIDGSEHFLSPERAVELQQMLGADIIMALDQPPIYGQSQEQVALATRRTHLWAERSRAAHSGKGQSLFAIVQGGTFPELRRESARFLAALDFPGYALGGLSLGEPRELMWPAVEIAVASLPPSRPRYLMGVGSPEELVEGVARGMDLFDSALPTRLGRTGAFFTRRGRHNLRNACFREQEGPLQPGCPCYACRTFSTAYLHHLFRAGELLSLRLLTIHNLTFILTLMAEMRQAIISGHFPEFREQFQAQYAPTPQEVRLARKREWLAQRGIV